MAMSMYTGKRLQTCLLTFLVVWLVLVGETRAVLAGPIPHVQSFDDVTVFQTTVAENDAIWMITFYSSSSESQSAENLHPEISMAASITRGVFHFGAVDVATDSGKEIADKYNVRATSSLPIIYLFTDEAKPQKYTGKKTTQEILNKMVQTGIETIQTRAGGASGSSAGGSAGSSKSSSTGPSKVVHLTSSNFQEKVLDNPLVSAVAFTAPWCGHCKALIPDWEQAAKQLDGEGAFLGWVDATVEEELAARYRVQGYPTIKLFPGGAHKSYSDAMDYEGGRTAQDIVRFLLAEVDRTGVPKPIPELVSEDVLRENCAGHNHICVIAALPHILDSGVDGRKAYQETLAKVSKSFRGSAFSFLWFEGTAQPDLEQSLDLTFGFPAVAAFSMDKEAFVVMRTSFSEKNVASFLRGVTSGRQRIAQVSTMPKVLTVEPWNGLEAAPVEDEIPLCEIMGTCEEEGEL